MSEKKVTKKVHGELRAARKDKADRKRQAQSRQTAGEQVPEQVPPEPAGATKGREHTVAASMPPRTTKAQANLGPQAMPDAPPDDSGELVVFAFRLTRAERDRIHAAAGSAKASKFVRELAVAAAQGDGPTVLGILDRVQVK